MVGNDDGVGLRCDGDLDGGLQAGDGLRCGFNRTGEGGAVGVPFALLLRLELFKLLVEQFKACVAFSAQSVVFGADLGGAGDEEGRDEEGVAGTDLLFNLAGEVMVRGAFSPDIP